MLPLDGWYPFPLEETHHPREPGPFNSPRSPLYPSRGITRPNLGVYWPQATGFKPPTKDPRESRKHSSHIFGRFLL